MGEYLVAGLESFAAEQPGYILPPTEVPHPDYWVVGSRLAAGQASTAWNTIDAAWNWVKILLEDLPVTDDINVFCVSTAIGYTLVQTISPQFTLTKLP